MSRFMEKVFIVATTLAYIITIFFNQASTGVFFKDIQRKIFNNRSTGSVSDTFRLQIVPAGATFSIWGVIYVWQTLWIIYTWTLFCRPSAPSVLTVPYYISYICSCIGNVSWLISWAHLKDIISMFLLLATVASLYSALFFVHRSVYKSEGALRKSHPKDLICIRALVQNGVAFYATWTTIASMINVAVVLKYSAKLSDNTASCIALAILLVLLIVWFSLQNFFLRQYFEYTFSTWPVVIVASIGIIAKNWNPSQASSIMSAIILTLAIVFYITRILLGIKRFLSARKTMLV